MILPLFAAPPTVVSVHGHGWLFDDGVTAFDQILNPNMGADAAQFLTGPFDLAVKQHLLRPGRKVRYIHDWRACTTYSVDAREALMQWGRAELGHTEETIIAIAPTASPFLRIALQTAMLVMQRLRMRISLVEDLSPLIGSLSVKKPLPAGA